MPISKYDVVRIVRDGTSGTEKIALLALAGEKPGLWEGLEEVEVLAVLRHAISSTGVIEHLNQEAVRHMLVEQYTSMFQLHGPVSPERRQEDLPLPDVFGNISGIGSFLGLQGFEAVVQQIYRRLLRLNTGFCNVPDFTRSLQLLRVVAAPGLGKSTLLKEVWTRLYQLAHEASADEESDPKVAYLNKRILSSLRPDKTMAFVLDLLRSDLQELHALEELLGAHASGVLALRMLYSSIYLKSGLTYNSFLIGMDRRLLHSLEPLDVLYFWQQAGKIEEGTTWMAVFAVDEANAAVPAPTLQKPSWLQAALSNFVMLRQRAAELEGSGELLCMPVVITASTRSSASSLEGTASGHSLVKDVHVRPLTEMQMQAVISDLAKRINNVPAVPSPLPTQLLLLLQLIGGNPRMLSQALCLLAGSPVLHNQEFPAGHRDCWKWLQGDFHLIHIVTELCTAMRDDKWRGWLAGNDLKVKIMNQLVAHCVCRVSVTRQEIVPGSEAGGRKGIKWQDLENDGVAYIGEPGQGLCSDGSGDSSSSGASLAAAAAASEPQPEGVREPDSQPCVVSMPPILLVAAFRFMEVPNNRLVWVPLLNHLTDDWRSRELTDVSILVARLLFWHDVLLQPIVSLKELLGGIDVGVHDMSFRVPEGNFAVSDVKSQLTQSAELQSMVNNMETQWAFRGPGNFGPDSWLLLQRSDDAESEAHPVVAIWIQSKKRQAASSMQSTQLVGEAAKMLHLPGVDNLMVYVTDQHLPTHHGADFCVPKTVVVADACLPVFYSSCVALVKGALSGLVPPKKRPRGA